MSLLSWIYGDDANAAKAAEADAELRRLNDERAYKFSEGWKQAVDADYASQNTIGVKAQAAEIDAGFAEGWNDGGKNVTGFVSGIFKVAGDVLSSVLLGIPAWVWIAAAGALWVYLGAPGLRKLKGKFA